MLHGRTQTSILNCHFESQRRCERCSPREWGFVFHSPPRRRDRLANKRAPKAYQSRSFAPGLFGGVWSREWRWWGPWRWSTPSGVAQSPSRQEFNRRRRRTSLGRHLSQSKEACSQVILRPPSLFLCGHHGKTNECVCLGGGRGRSRRSRVLLAISHTRKKTPCSCSDLRSVGLEKPLRWLNFARGPNVSFLRPVVHLASRLTPLSTHTHHTAGDASRQDPRCAKQVDGSTQNARQPQPRVDSNPGRDGVVLVLIQGDPPRLPPDRRPPHAPCKGSCRYVVMRLSWVRPLVLTPSNRVVCPLKLTNPESEIIRLLG